MSSHPLLRHLYDFPGWVIQEIHLTQEIAVIKLHCDRLGFKPHKQHLGVKPHPAGIDNGCCFSRVPTLLQYVFNSFNTENLVRSGNCEILQHSFHPFGQLI